MHISRDFPGSNRIYLTLALCISRSPGVTEWHVHVGNDVCSRSPFIFENKFWQWSKPKAKMVSWDIRIVCDRWFHDRGRTSCNFIKGMVHTQPRYDAFAHHQLTRWFTLCLPPVITTTPTHWWDTARRWRDTGIEKSICISRECVGKR